jgi:hypothetical protein
MNASELELRIRGPELSPDTMRAGDLAKILMHLEAAVVAAADLRTEDGEPEPVILGLRTVREGSAVFAFAVSPAVWDAWAGVLQTLARDGHARLKRTTQARLAELSKLFVTRGWTGEFTGPGVPRVEVSASRPIPEPLPATITGRTTLTGTCVVVGGVEPRVQIKPTGGGKMVSVRATNDVVRELAQRLYGTVVLDGDATWDTDTGELLRFRLLSVLPTPKPGGAVAAFRALREAYGAAWDGVDADEYVRRMRSPDEEWP